MFVPHHNATALFKWAVICWRGNHTHSGLLLTPFLLSQRPRKRAALTSVAREPAVAQYRHVVESVTDGNAMLELTLIRISQGTAHGRILLRLSELSHPRYPIRKLLLLGVLLLDFEKDISLPTLPHYSRPAFIRLSSQQCLR